MITSPIKPRYMKRVLPLFIHDRFLERIKAGPFTSRELEASLGPMIVATKLFESSELPDLMRLMILRARNREMIVWNDRLKIWTPKGHKPQVIIPERIGSVRKVDVDGVYGLVLEFGSETDRERWRRFFAMQAEDTNLGRPIAANRRCRVNGNPMRPRMQKIRCGNL